MQIFYITTRKSLRIHSCINSALKFKLYFTKIKTVKKVSFFKNVLTNEL